MPKQRVCDLDGNLCGGPDERCDMCPLRLGQVRAPIGDALGPCGCVDYHMADCPLVTGGEDTGMSKDDYLDLYAGSYPDDWPDDEGW